MADGNITVVTTGMLPALIMVSAVLTAPAAAALLWLYRRAVVRAMAATAGPSAAAASDTTPASAASQPLRIRYVHGAQDPGGSALYRQARRSAAWLALAHAAGGTAYAVIFASAWLVISGDGFLPGRFLWLAACYAWPTVLAIAICWALSRTERIAIAAGYLLLVFLVLGYVLARNPEASAASLGFFWLYANAAPTVLFLLFLHPRVRAVGPLVLTFMVAAVTGSQLLLSLVGAADAHMRLAVDVGALLGLGGTGMFFAIMVAGFCLFGCLGWLLLKRLGERYRRGRTSDQMLTLDAMWLMFGIVQSITLSFEGAAWLATGLVGFAAYKLVTAVGLCAVRRIPMPGITLLWLRVFRLGRRSERLFDGLSKAWLRCGNIALIAGPDLVTSTVEPHEFLEFVGGGLSRRFVRDAADLERRLGAMPRATDPDGRHRVNEFFCYADTWQMTMKRLAGAAHAIVMDLRSFARGNAGCLYEIEQLLAGVDLRRAVLLVDATTDRDFLEQTLQATWERVGARAARHDAVTPEVRLLRLADPGARSLRVLLKSLLADQGEVRHASGIPAVAA